MSQKQNQKRINEIKDLIYEVEGLLELMQQRSEKLNAFAPIVLKRMAEAKEKLDELVSVNDAPATPINIFKVEDSDFIGEPDETQLSDQIEVSETVQGYSIDEPKNVKPEENTFVEVSVEHQVPVEEKIPVVKKDIIEGKFQVEDDDSVEEVYSLEEDTSVNAENNTSSPIAPSLTAPRDKVPVFCLNDRYRFRRAIFGGSEAEFNSTMQLIAGFADFKQAQEFFYTDMGLDKEDEDVKDFMEIISNYFAR